MNNTITAQELKTQGTQVIRKKINKFQEAVITVRGKESYVVLSLDQYKHLRECELEAAIIETKQEIIQKKYTVKSVKNHLKDLKNV